MAYLFPYTTVPPLAAETLLKLFDELIVLQPTVGTEQPSLPQTDPDNRLKVQCPFEAGHEQVNQAVSAYTKWAQEHGGTDLQQIRSQLEVPSFLDEESSYHLEALIRSPQEGITAAEQGRAGQMIINSRIFLSLAQEFDSRNWEMETNLGQVKASEASLFAQLHGRQPEIDTPPRLEDEFQNSYMIRERMAAWSIFLIQPDMTPGPLVTLCPEIKAHIEERVPAGDRFYSDGWVLSHADADTGSQWRGQFKEALEHWLVDPAKEQNLSDLLSTEQPESTSGVHISIYRIQACSPIRWMGGPQSEDQHSNGVVVIVENVI